MKLINKLIFIFLYLTIPSLLISTSLKTSWEINNNSSSLYFGGTKVFDSKIPLVALPENLNQNQLIDFGLLVGEYYISRVERENLLNLMEFYKKNQDDYSLVILLLMNYWELEKGDNNDLTKTLENYHKIEKDNYLNNLSGLLVKIFNKKNSYKPDIKDYQNLSCTKSNLYNSLCKVMKLRIVLDLLTEELIAIEKGYELLDRNLAPFFEENDLNYIPFIDKIIPDLGARLAYLGLAGEAVHFQKMQIENDKLFSRFELITYERLSFYQMLNGDLQDSEDTLAFILKNLKAASILRNSILLKAGSVAYHRKDYKKALQYFSELNLKYWGRTIRHPINDDTITPYNARNFVGYVISKAINPATAVQALAKLKSKKTDEEDLFIQLRIAHILFQERPKITEKITDDIIYTAQSKGWKRVEYLATLLNGYTNILNKKNRKSVIQFTKSQGILGSSDSKYTSEWIRLSGMLIGRLQGKERGNHNASFHQLINMMRKSDFDYDTMAVKFYLDRRFGPEEIIERALEYFENQKDYESLLSTLYYSQFFSKKENVHKYGVLQLNVVNKNLKIYKGFRPAIDNIYYKGKNTKLLNLLSDQITNEFENFNSKFISSTTLPLISIFPTKNNVFIVTYNPDRNEKYRWKVLSFKNKDYGTLPYYEKLISDIPWIKGNTPYQIYLNKQGTEFYQIMKKNQISQDMRFFYTFQPNQNKPIKGFDLTAVECNEKTDLKNTNIKYYSPDYFEGNKSFDSTNRLHIWNFTEVFYGETPNTYDSYRWKCNKDNFISYKKLIRRVDSKSSPTAILMTNSILNDSTTRILAKDYLNWTDFWIKKGVSTIFFIDKLEEDALSKELFESLSNDSFEINKIQQLMNSDKREGLILTKEPR
jgi:hypothetical protein